MHAPTIAIAFLFLKGTMAGYGVVCLVKSRGCIDYRVTKDCCAAVKGQQHFDEVDHVCKTNNLCGGNSVNVGAVARCCDSRGDGSTEVPSGGECRTGRRPPKC